MIKNEIKKEENEFKYCWLDINTGEFSNSWNDKLITLSSDDLLIARAHGFKLIKYQCITDDKFEFYNRMKLK